MKGLISSVIFVIILAALVGVGLYDYLTWNDIQTVTNYWGQNFQPGKLLFSKDNLNLQAVYLEQTATGSVAGLANDANSNYSITIANNTYSLPGKLVKDKVFVTYQGNIENGAQSSDFLGNTKVGDIVFLSLFTNIRTNDSFINYVFISK